MADTPNDRLGPGVHKPVAVVLVVDTSPPALADGAQPRLRGALDGGALVSVTPEATTSLADAIATSIATNPHRVPTEAQITVGDSYEDLGGKSPPPTNTNYLLIVPATASAGIYLGPSGSLREVLPGQELALPTGNLSGWYAKRIGGVDVVITVQGTGDPPP